MNDEKWTLPRRVNPFAEQQRIEDELAALRAFVREVSQQDPTQVPGQRQSNKERAEDLCEQWGITE